MHYKTIVILSTVLLFSACKKESTETVVSELAELKNSYVSANIEQDSLDIIYGTRSAFTRHGASVLAMNVEKMQKVLRQWPEARKGNKEPCYMTIRNETARLLNLIDGLATSVKEVVDYPYLCRESIAYNYDDVRVSELWNRL